MDWIPAITTTSLLTAALWLGKNALLERLKGSVQHEFNEKLENLKAELREKERQIDAIRSGALSGVSHRQAKIYERKLNATEELWSSVVSMAGAKNISAMMAHIKFEAAAKETAKNPQAREIFKLIGTPFDPAKMQISDAGKARPFISKLAWAYYSAYKSIVYQSVIRLEALKSGAEQDLSKSEEVKTLVKVALPHHEKYIEKYGNETLHYLLEELEEKILSEIENIINGNVDDKESVLAAANILKAAESLNKSVEGQV